MVVALIGTMPHRRPPRLPTFDYRGAYRYFVTCCTSGRRRVFIEGDVVQLRVQQILHAGSFYAVELRSNTGVLRFSNCGKRGTTSESCGAMRRPLRSSPTFSTILSERVWSRTPQTIRLDGRSIGTRVRGRGFRNQSALLQGHFTVTDSIRAPSSTRSTTSRPETTRAKTVYS
jgi:hypothetical protein